MTSVVIKLINFVSYVHKCISRTQSLKNPQIAPTEAKSNDKQYYWCVFCFNGKILSLVVKFSKQHNTLLFLKMCVFAWLHPQTSFKFWKVRLLSSSTEGLTEKFKQDSSACPHSEILLTISWNSIPSPQRNRCYPTPIAVCTCQSLVTCQIIFTF